MTDIITTAARVALAAAVGAEGIAALARFEDRKRQYAEAVAQARQMGRTLVVVGDPNSGAHTRLKAAYGCGDVCVDLTSCPACPVGVAVDLTRGRVEQVRDNSAVVYVSCVLEYVNDPAAAMREIFRMAGSPANVFIVPVQPWTVTAAMYPGAKNTVRRREDGSIGIAWDTSPVPVARKVATVVALGALAFLAIGPMKVDERGQGPR